MQLVASVLVLRLCFSLLAVNFPQGTSPCHGRWQFSTSITDCFLGRQMNGPDILTEEIVFVEVVNRHIGNFHCTASSAKGALKL